MPDPAPYLEVRDRVLNDPATRGTDARFLANAVCDLSSRLSAREAALAEAVENTLLTCIREARAFGDAQSERDAILACEGAAAHMAHALGYRMRRDGSIVKQHEEARDD